MQRSLFARSLAAVALTALLASTATSAELYFVRNKPFTQVMTVAGEALVNTEAFLRAVGYNWTVDGNVVTLTTAPAANSGIPHGPVTFRHGSQQVQLDANLRGSSTYVPLRPLAQLAGYTVTVNRVSGTVDVAKGRFATEEEQKLTGDLAAQREQERKAADEAWAKKVAERKAKKEAEARQAEEAGKNKEAQGSDADENGKKAAETAPAAPATPAPAEAANAEKPAEAKEAPKEARLEVFRTDAVPDPSTGTVTITCEIKNMGEAPSKPISGRVTLKGPSSNVSATSNAAGGSAVWMQKAVSGPALMPGTNWVYTERYRHPSGNSMPLGNIVADFKLNATR